LDKALDKDKPKDVLAALDGLERLEPDEPRWPQRTGDYLLRKGQRAQAEAAYLRALDVLIKQGFLPRAVALAKLVVGINPARADILNRLNQDAARALRNKPSFSAFKPPPLPTPPPPEPSDDIEPLSLVPGGPVPGVAAAARPLRRATDAALDEVRFEDLDDADLVELDTSDMEAISSTTPHGTPVLAPPDPSAALVARLSATALFAEVPPHTLAALVVASMRIELSDGEWVVKKGAPADAVFVIAEGTARVVLPKLQSGGVDLGEGQLFGEACLIRKGRRQADVVARGRLVLLRIGVQDLRNILATHAELNGLLFDLLAGRLVANLLQTSPLFSAFDMGQRQEIARMFEVRQAPAGTVLQQAGKRCDGVYIALMGEFDMEEGGLVAELPAGSIFGHSSLLTRAPANRTIRATTDTVVLRMPAAKFSSFAAQFPPALEYLSQLASAPMPMWPI
jgi:CRP-like cAMP-binding protein